MEQDGESQATAEIIAGADTHSTSPNGFGASDHAERDAEPGGAASARRSWAASCSRGS